VEDILRARQVELEQQLANAEDYNNNLHEKMHQLHNQVHPLVPPGAAKGDDAGDDVSDMDIDHEE
jgi:hypothetical protein